LQKRRPLNLLIALPAEAKPLIKSLALQRLQPVGAIPCYVSQDIQLVVSGPGLHSIPMAVNYLQAITPTECHPAWLNLGICGHGSLAIGELFIADQVFGPDDTHWKLGNPLYSSASHGRLICVTEPQSTYRQEFAYDMESSEFLKSLTPTTPMDRLHILKVVSDNPDSGIENINAKQVEKLITAQISQIKDFISRITAYE
jgi:nucleoside phosphorylase